WSEALSPVVPRSCATIIVRGPLSQRVDNFLEGALVMTTLSRVVMTSDWSYSERLRTTSAVRHRRGRICLMTISVPEPGRLTVGTDGTLTGATGNYTKRLGDMAGVYRDAQAYEEQVAQHGPDTVVYTVQEHRNVTDDGALI